MSKVDYTSSKLLIKKAKMQDAGKYTCECEFENGHKSDEQIVLYIYGERRLTHTKYLIILIC